MFLLLIGCFPHLVPRAEAGAPGQELLLVARPDGEVRNLRQPARGQHALQTAAWRVPDRPIHLRAAPERRLLHPNLL